MPVMSCKLEANAECYEIIGGMSIMQLSGAQGVCTSRGGTYSDATWCPWTAVVGTCSTVGISPFGVALIERYYPPTDLASAKVSCEERNGVWASN